MAGARVVERRPAAAAVVLVCGILGTITAAATARADLHDTPNRRGALAGKTVVLSPGHGIRPDASGGWSWQRGTGPASYADDRRLREDIHTAEIVIEYLQRYLSGAGAVVFTCRERSFQRHEVIVDDGAGGYSETGTWSRSTQHPGFYGTGGYRWAQVAAAESAVARFSATLPASGRYPVYVWYTPGTNRSADALYRVHHAGGVTPVRVDQSAYQPTWFYLGTFWFEAGRPAMVELSNQGSSSGKVVVADAVRFGGGIGASGLPRWQEAAIAYLPYVGFRGSADDVTIRPRFASWLAGDPAGSWRTDFRYLSLHTNAGNGTNRGTMTISYTNGRQPSWSGWGTGPAHYPTNPSSLQQAADTFAAVVQQQLVRDLDAIYPPWGDRGLRILNAGELRECTAMPACLVELAYHDNPADVDHLRNNGFRHTAARAIYKAIARSFDPHATIVPLPPAAVRLVNVGGGQLRASWSPGIDPLEPSAVPTSYRVYTSLDGRAFDDGRSASGTSLVLGPYPAGSVVHVRVAGVNAGGEGLPSKVVAARAGRTAAPEVLIVDGFTRAFLHNYKNLEQHWGDAHMVSHAVAFARGTALAFDGATADAVESGAVVLAGYPMVDWFVGRESTADETFSDQEQLLVASYLGSGGAMLVSGSEIGWDLDYRGSPSDRQFYADWLRAAFVADDAQSFGVRPKPGSALAAAPALLRLDDGSHGSYLSAYPDVIRPLARAAVALDYEGGAGAAAIQLDDGYRLLYLAFPLEVIWDDAERAALVREAADWLLAGLGGAGGGSTGASGGGSAGGTGTGGNTGTGGAAGSTGSPPAPGVSSGGGGRRKGSSGGCTLLAGQPAVPALWPLGLVLLAWVRRRRACR
ncbi:MAG: xanthan lyase [Planctomycetota bacterium]|nr:MAG: xanthan lyase [Planctomycetota bacterium]